MLLAATARDRASPTLGQTLAVLTLLSALAVIAHAPHVVFLHGDTNLDFNAHYRWSIEAARAMAAGDPWPHWMPYADKGLGEPALLYYAPLYYLLTGAVRPFAANTWAAMHVVEGLSTILCGWFSFRLVRAYASHRAAVLAAILAALSPMPIMLFQGFNGFPWAAAFAPASYLFWAMLRPGARTPNLHAMIALALTICTHTVSGLICMIALCPLALVGSDGRLRLETRSIANIALVFAGGLLLSAAYLLPAVLYQPLVDFGVLRTKFVPWRSFVFPTFTAMRFGVKWFAFQVPIPLAAFIGASSGAAVLLRRASDPALRRLGRSGAVMLGVAILLAIELSYPLWFLDTPLRLVQFPFRMTMVGALLLPILAPIAFDVARGWRRTALGLAMIGSVLLALILVARLSTQARHLDLGVDRIAPYGGLPEYRILNDGHSEQAYVEAGLLTGECARLGIICSPMSRDGSAFHWHVGSIRPVRLRLPLFDFPAFAVTVDGRDVPRLHDPAAGVIAVDLPGGAHDVGVAWRALPLQRTGAWITGAVALMLVVYALWWRGRRGLSVERRSAAMALGRSA